MIYGATVTAPGLAQALARQLTDRLSREADVAGLTGTAMMAATAPKNKAPGRDRRGLTSLSTPSLYQHDVTVMADGVNLRFYMTGDRPTMGKFYAIETGNTGHSISARSAPFLVFPRTDDPVGQIIRRRSVNHPGNAATNYYRNAIRTVVKMMLANLS